MRRIRINVLEFTLCLLLFIILVSIYLYTKQPVISSENQEDPPGPPLALTPFMPQRKESVSKDKNKLTKYEIETKLMEDKLVENIKSILIPPPNKMKSLSIARPMRTHFSQNKQDEVIAKMLKYKKNGTFFEAGALDGELYSNTLYFERTLGWTGLLVEPGAISFNKLKNRKRNAHLLKACISPTKRANTLQFDSRGGNSAFAKLVDEGTHVKKADKLTCYPLYHMLLAIGNPVIDYLSLDIEGDELKVLQTVPWEKVHVKILDIEISRILPEGSEAVRVYMEHRGYEFYRLQGEDYIFYDPAYKNELDL